MSTKITLSHVKLSLPNIDVIETSEQAFGNAFLKAAQCLAQYLEQFQAAMASEDKRDALNSVILALFAKMRRHYYSYALLEVHNDEIGSQFLLEHLCEAAITLAYLLEEGDKDLFFDYVSASVAQAHYLLITVEEQLRQSPNHKDLGKLKVQLEAIIAQKSNTQLPTTAPTAYSWGTGEVNSTAKRGAILGLNFLNNPARQIALKVVPASFLELQLSSFNSPLSTQVNPKINFTELRDAAHLCLHVTRIWLEEVANDQVFNFSNVEHQQLSNTLFQWFHDAHNAYQLRCLATNK